MPSAPNKRSRGDESHADGHNAKRRARDNNNNPEASNATIKKEDGVPGPLDYLPHAEDTAKFESLDNLQPIPSVASNTVTNGAVNTPAHDQDETKWLHLRAVISSAEAATIIGKRGENVTVVRRLAGARCTISDYTRGALERILTVSGTIDSVSQAFGLIVRNLLQEPLEGRSNDQSKAYPVKLLIPDLLMGAVIGQKGLRIREIQNLSGVRLTASHNVMPFSSERSLNVHGVADAVHRAVWYIGTTLAQQLESRYGGLAASAYATRNGAPTGTAPGGLQVVPYSPSATTGIWGHPSTLSRTLARNNAAASAQANANPGAAYGQQQPQPQPQQPTYGQHFGAGRGGYPVPPQQQPFHLMGPNGQQTPMPQMPGNSGQPITQQIFIPNDMVGAIIGKGGAKINEIRQLSQASIKIAEPNEAGNDRMVTITGLQEANNMALYLLYQRLGWDHHKYSGSIPESLVIRYAANLLPLS